MNSYYTENLEDFQFREIKILRNILNSWVEFGLPKEFYNYGVRPAMNTSSGFVFLTNEDYQVAMLNDEKLEIWHSLPASGEEGFLPDLLALNAPDSFFEDDVDYLLELAANSNTELPKSWLQFIADGYRNDYYTCEQAKSLLDQQV